MSDINIKAAKNVAENMMNHFWNWNIVTDGYEIDDPNFSDEEKELASEIELCSDEFKKLVIEAITKEINEAS